MSFSESIRRRVDKNISGSALVRQVLEEWEGIVEKRLSIWNEVVERF